MNIFIANPFLDQETYQIITRNVTESKFREPGDNTRQLSDPMYFNTTGRSRDPSWLPQVSPDLQEGVLYAHHINTQILPPLDSYINEQPMHVWMMANCSSFCFSWGCFLRRVRRPWVPGLSLMKSIPNKLPCITVEWWRIAWKTLCAFSRYTAFNISNRYF